MYSPMSLDRRSIDRAVDEIEERLVALSRRIHDHPELSFEERRASQWIAEFVEEVGKVPVERPFGRMETAFCARVGTGRGPKVALLAEYDALPEIGHACVGVDHGMPRRMLFTLRRCHCLVPIRELDLDIFVVVMDADVTPRERSLAGGLRRLMFQSQRST